MKKGYFATDELKVKDFCREVIKVINQLIAKINNEQNTIKEMTMENKRLSSKCDYLDHFLEIVTQSLNDSDAEIKKLRKENRMLRDNKTNT